jgi:hypothetical protein
VLQFSALYCILYYVAIAVAVVKTTLIYPATPTHIEKYRFHERFVLRETRHDYETITLPYIQEHQPSLQVRGLPVPAKRLPVGV